MKYEAQRRSTRYSTAIEGNVLEGEELRRGIAGSDRTANEQQQEVRNYWRALEWLEQQVESNAAVDEEFMRRLHRLIDVRGRGRRGEMSDYRTGECPVVDSTTGAITYAPPEPQDVPALMAALVAWRNSPEAKQLPVPVRAAIVSYQFVIIHPFDDGNGRTARALGTAELWFGRYMMRGFLSMEEHYFQDLDRYYASLAMDLPEDYYERDENYDITPWVEYFVETMATAAEAVRHNALQLLQAQEKLSGPQELPWEPLSRRQQQVLMRLTLKNPGAGDSPSFTAGDIADWFMVSLSTARNWLANWREEGFVQPTSPDQERVRSWGLSDGTLAALVSALRREIRDSAAGRGE